MPQAAGLDTPAGGDLIRQPLRGCHRLAAARSRRGFFLPPACHSLPRRTLRAPQRGRLFSCCRKRRIEIPPSAGGRLIIAPTGADRAWCVVGALIKRPRKRIKTYWQKDRAEIAIAISARGFCPYFCPLAQIRKSIFLVLVKPVQSGNASSKRAMQRVASEAGRTASYHETSSSYFSIADAIRSALSLR